MNGKQIKGLVVLCAVVLLLTSCGLFGQKFEFINNSPYTLRIDPNGQDWSGFYLSPGSSRTVTINEKQCYFLYDHASLVTCETGNFTVTFW